MKFLGEWLADQVETETMALGMSDGLLSLMRYETMEIPWEERNCRELSCLLLGVCVERRPVLDE